MCVCVCVCVYVYSLMLCNFHFHLRIKDPTIGLHFTKDTTPCIFVYSLCPVFMKLKININLVNKKGMILPPPHRNHINFRSQVTGNYEMSMKFASND